MIIITGSVSVPDENRAEAIRLGCEHSARSRSEPGCVSHNCHVDAEDPSRIHFFERWQDMASVQAHFGVPESGDFVRRMAQLSTSPPEMQIYQAEPIERTGG